MAVSLKTKRLYLTEHQHKIQEIGQRLPPFQNEFNFSEGSQGLESTFTDPKGNKIKVIFHPVGNNYSCEVDFTVNGNSQGNGVNMDTKTFFLIISTVIECINSYIKKYHPNQLRIDGLDKNGKEGQKNKLWREYAILNIEDDNYVYGEESDGSFGFQIKGLKR